VDAWRTIQAGAGDCDDKVTLLCSLLAVAGFPSQFVVGGMTPDQMDHVWCEVWFQNRWVPLDPTNEKADPGWKQPFPYGFEYPIWN